MGALFDSVCLLWLTKCGERSDCPIIWTNIGTIETRRQREFLETGDQTPK